MDIESKPTDPFLLYHSFPRKRHNENSNERTIATLCAILELGLLATPEIMEWAFMDGQKFHVAQKRICFTALRADELDEHSKIFGALSLGFDRSILEQIGAAPVFYVSRSNNPDRKARNFGAFHLERLYQLMTITQELRKRDEKFSFRDKLINLEDMDAFTRYLTTLFCPIEDADRDKARFYYAQKEWRIQGNIFFKGKPLSRRLNTEESERIFSLSPSFFGKKQTFPTGEYRNIDQSLLIPDINDQPMRHAIRQIVAPKEFEQDIYKILAEWDINPDVVIL